MFGLGATELIVVLVMVVVLFGAGKLPQLGDGMGRAIRNFKRSIDDVATVERVKNELSCDH